jgi:hypothetical protein
MNDPKYLGIPNIQFSLTDKEDEREDEFSKQRLERGFDDSETWSLRDTIARFIIPRLKRFREISIAYPAEMTYEEWNSILDKMIKAFELVDDRYLTLTDEQQKEYEEGISLFKEHFMGLWW